MPTAALTDEEIDRYISEITTGLKSVKVRKINSSGHQEVVSAMLCQPSGEDKRLAQIRYVEAKEIAKEVGLRTKSEIMKEFVDKYNIYTSNDKVIEASLKDQIKAQQSMYKSAKLPEYKANFKDKIIEAENKYFEFTAKKMQYEKFSVEEKAEEARAKYLVYCCTLDSMDLSRYWSTYKAFQDETDMDFIRDLSHEVRVFMFGYAADILRALARSHQWKSIWIVSMKTQASLFGMPIGIRRAGSSPFSSPVADWSMAQLQLCNWSIFYDNIMQGSEPPPNSVVEDDDLLDKYVEVQIKKQEKDRKGNLSSSSGSKAGEAEDLFIYGDEKEYMFDENGELRK